MKNLRVVMTPKMERAKALALEQMTKWGLLPPSPYRPPFISWLFRFNNRKRGMGLCVYPKLASNLAGRIELSRHLVERNDLDEVLDTILHEIAHALAGPDAGHGPRWKEMCQKVGANPERCGEANMPQGAWQARCPSCSKVYHRHRKPKCITRHYCPPCGRVDGSLTWVRTAG